jgi:hypothetical protein
LKAVEYERLRRIARNEIWVGKPEIRPLSHRGTFALEARLGWLA